MKVENYKRLKQKRIIDTYQVMHQNHVFQQKKLLLIFQYTKNVTKKIFSFDFIFIMINRRILNTKNIIKHYLTLFNIIINNTIAGNPNNKKIKPGKYETIRLLYPNGKYET